MFGEEKPAEERKYAELASQERNETNRRQEASLELIRTSSTSSTAVDFSLNDATPGVPLQSTIGSVSKPALLSISEKLKHLVAAVHTAANSSQKFISFQNIDERFRESLRNWTERENARLKYEAAIKEHEKTQEELELQQSIHEKIDPEKMLAAKVSRCARIGSYIFGCINIPCFNVAAFFTGAADVIDEVGKEVIDHPLHRAEEHEKKAALAVKKAQEIFENIQAEAPEFQRETERLEQEARDHEKRQILALAKKIVPPLVGDGHALWREWAEGIVGMANFNLVWIEVLATHGQQDRDWVLEQIRTAWADKTRDLEQYVDMLKNQGSSEQQEKKHLAEEALKKAEDAAALRKVVLDDQRKIQTLTEDVALARQDLAVVNQKLNELEKTPLFTTEKSTKGIAVMDASLKTLNQQWTQVKELKEILKEKEEELREIKFHYGEQEPIAAAKEIDFNTSLKKYQKYAERLDRNIERAMARCEANRLAGNLISNSSDGRLLSQTLMESEVQGELAVFPILENFRFNSADFELDEESKIDRDFIQERQAVSFLKFTDDDDSPSPSKENILRRRNNSLTAQRKESSEFDFPIMSRLSAKSFDYLQGIFHRVESEEKKEEESGCVSFLRGELNLENPEKIDDLNEDHYVDLSLTPHPDLVEKPGMAIHQALEGGLDFGGDSSSPLPHQLSPLPCHDQYEVSILDIRNQAARKSPEEALPDWSKAITQARNLVVTYQQIVDANEEALKTLNAELASQEGSATIGQIARRMELESNLKQAREKKMDWMIKLSSYKADEASDLAIYAASLASLDSNESHEHILWRAEAVAQAYLELKELCGKSLREHVEASLVLQFSWMRLHEEAVEQEQYWQKKARYTTFNK